MRNSVPVTGWSELDRQHNWQPVRAMRFLIFTRHTRDRGQSSLTVARIGQCAAGKGVILLRVNQSKRALWTGWNSDNMCAVGPKGRKDATLENSYCRFQSLTVWDESTPTTPTQPH